jgi:hypothetical protein
MWGAGRNDLMEPDPKPCNLIALFRIVDDRLTMTIFNRSNDLIWGCCGANAVHFPIMQEYIAGKLGIPLGGYWQVSNNLHLYLSHIDKMRKRIDTKDFISLGICQYLNDTGVYEDSQKLMAHPEAFDDDLKQTMEYIDLLHEDVEGYDGNIANPFLRCTVLPMARAHYLYKCDQMDDALDEISKVEAADWKRAGHEWLERRAK